MRTDRHVKHPEHEVCPSRCRDTRYLRVIAVLGCVLVLSACNSAGLDAPGLFDRQTDLPPPDTTITPGASDDLQEQTRVAIARAVGAVDLDAGSTSTVAQSPETVTSVSISRVKLDESRGVQCRSFESRIANRVGVRDFYGYVCPTNSGWRLLQPGENRIAGGLPGVATPEKAASTDAFVTAPPPISIGSKITTSNVPLITSDVVDSDLFSGVEPIQDPVDVPTTSATPITEATPTGP